MFDRVEYGLSGRGTWIVGRREHAFESSPQRSFLFALAALFFATAASAVPGVLIESTEVIGGAEIGFSVQSSDRFGVATEWLGDLDADGFPEVAVGAYQDDEPSNSGAVYIFSLAPDGTVVPGSATKWDDANDPNDAIQLSSGDLFGVETVPLGDFDGDGNLEFAVSAMGAEAAGQPSASGEIWILDVDPTTREMLTGYAIASGTTNVGALPGGQDFGRGLANGGDWDGDGAPELIVGANQNADGGAGSQRGAIYILYLEPPVLPGNNAVGVKGVKKISETTGDLTTALDVGARFGASITPVGDLDSNGQIDLAVGAWGQGGEGAVFLLFMSPTCAAGPASCAVLNDVVLTEGSEGFVGSLAANDHFGAGIDWVVDSAGVIAPRLAVGVDASDLGSTDLGIFRNYGAVTTFGLSPTGSIIDQEWIYTNFNGLPGIANRGQFGISVAGGDINSDGMPDLVVGSFLEASQSGRVRSLLFDPCRIIVTGAVTYSSRDDDGVRFCPAPTISESQTTLHLWLTGGDAASSVPANACVEGLGDGDELCGVTVEIELSDGLTIQSYTPASLVPPDPPLEAISGERTNDPVLGGQLLQVAWVAPTPPPLGPIKLGDLVVDWDGTPGARIQVTSASRTVDAGLGLRSMASLPIAVVPEPGFVPGVALGALLLAGAFRRRRMSPSRRSVRGDSWIRLGLLAGSISLMTMPVPASAGTSVIGQTNIFFTCPGSECQVHGAAAPGDIDGDGSTDLVIGYGQPEAEQALRTVFLDDGAVLGSQLIEIDNAIDNDPNANHANGLGTAIEALGDRNGDGVPDLVVGSSDTGPFTGLVTIVYLDRTGSASSFHRIENGAGGFTGTLNAGDTFGYGIAVADFNGDGIEDLAVGAPGDDQAALNAGAVWILYLDDAEQVTGHVKLTAGSGGFSGSLASGDGFGIDVTAVGDLDGNGTPDIAVGASGDDPDGAVWFVYLGPAMPGEVEVIGTQRISGTEGGFAFGSQSFMGGRLEWFPNTTGQPGGVLGVAFDGGFGQRGFWLLDVPPDFATSGLIRGGYAIGGFAPGVGASFAANFGFASSLAIVPDVNGDETPDLLTSTFVRNFGGPTGEAYLFFMADSDGDGLDDNLDNCPGGPGIDPVTSANPEQIDTDEDGIGDVCDVCPLVPDPLQADVDSDGTGDLCEPVSYLLQPTGTPAAPAWDILVECGAWGVTAGRVAVIPPESGTNPSLVLGCSVAPPGGICATIDTVASTTSGPGLATPAGVRDDAFYVDLVGNGAGGQVCQGLDLPAKIGAVTTDPISGTAVAAAALSEEGVGTPGFGDALAEDVGGAIPETEVRLITGSPLPRVSIELGPAVVTGGSTRWDVLLTGAIERYHRVTIGLVAPFGTTVSDFTFSGCTGPTAEPGDVRTCGAGVGPTVNPNRSWTVGPADALATPAGLKEHTMYIVVEGQLGFVGLPYLNLPGQNVVLGTVELAGTPDLEPALTLEGLDLIADRFSAGAIVPYERSLFGALSNLDEVKLVGRFNPADDIDSDGVQDLADNCAFIPNADQSDDGGFQSIEPDATGNACQCGDGTGDGVVQGGGVPGVDDFDEVFDLLAGKITNPVVAAGVRSRCSVAGTTECNIRDLVFLKKALDSAQPAESRCDAALSPAS